MIGSLALVLLGAAAAATPCESLTGLTLDHATVTSAEMMPEGPAAAPGGGRGRGGAAQAQGRGRGGAAPTAGRGRGGGPPAIIPAHCRVQIVLAPTSDSLINMELWLPPAGQWNGKFMGVGSSLNSMPIPIPRRSRRREGGR
jgi:hypothetical protein